MIKRWSFYFGCTCLVVAALLTFTTSATTAKIGPTPITIPFELVNRHIVLRASVDGSKPLMFLFDTGDKYAIIDHDRATALGLKLGNAIPVKGTGAVISGAFVIGSS